MSRRRDPDRLREQVNALLGRLGTRAAEARLHGDSRRSLHIACGRAGCLCTHDFPCEAGWMEVRVGDAVAVQPCPTCRPDVAAVAARSGGRREIFQSGIRDTAAREQAEQAEGEAAWDG